jgi:uncharacterized membrane protein
MGNRLYKLILGDILADHLRIAPTIVFYLAYPLDIVIFAVAPAMSRHPAAPTLIYSPLFGLFAYATYDLTNFATLRNWNWQIPLIEMAWGAFTTGVTATLAYYAASAIGSILGLSR